MADQTMDNLYAAAKAIDVQLDASRALSSTLGGYAASGLVVEDGTTDVALISDEMVSDYNGAVNGVLEAEYMTARDVFLQEHEQAMASLDMAIDDLTAATAVLATASVVMDMAASADSTQEQLQVQAALATMDASISQSDVDTYNAALGSVETYSQQAGAFLAAANNTYMTGMVNNFAAQNNLNIGSYTNATFSVDQMLITWGGQAIGFYGFNDVISSEEVYQDAGIYGSM